MTYSFNGTVSGDPTSPPVLGSGTGSLLPLGNLTLADRSFPDLSTGVVTGTFTFTFGDGSALFGDFNEQVGFSAPPAATPYTNVLNVTGGTGSLLWYSGVLTGTGTIDLVVGTYVNAGSGTFNTTPEPASLILFPLGWCVW